MGRRCGAAVGVAVSLNRILLRLSHEEFDQVPRGVVALNSPPPRP